MINDNLQECLLDGSEALGSYLRIQPCSDSAPELSGCSIQWYRLAAEDGKKDLISSMHAKGLMELLLGLYTPLIFIHQEKHTCILAILGGSLLGTFLSEKGNLVLFQEENLNLVLLFILLTSAG
ncbi:stomatal closure-related actin-binding protein 1-like isoform X1 [Camellia sinensis]|uniref:stomatal closure-related actin-binding protein 1-like isoform X1 n=1 Tax=Camellia sinensis TaxID=4442 RepID=UPI00103692CC|nr:stomatal closure-related actin-binding protein 1-like isoform X1 [Camellia sinensis]XP_028121336.1 stomatal closure-related actin-binding protein 1-like isoform X1 [Camellia sinensis]XP_028121337.1 stomatal closure-related actin-binding protein 1-like isoform X1 [Camellia sinensis]XP_028121338.1 stomatal closure-related actin-binding protein 1-like isoform X1 [Camellia sinensis]XP_028121339.1 stomatal closure-related actin-binding protein 1-like isoform X1 [Camellia sinensis]XP_028121340.1 